MHAYSEASTIIQNDYGIVSLLVFLFNHHSLVVIEPAQGFHEGHVASLMLVDRVIQQLQLGLVSTVSVVSAASLYLWQRLLDSNFKIENCL
jgi:hypothetical protein